MNANDFVSAEKIIAEVSQTVNDKGFRNGFSKGWFLSRIHDALQELAFDTFYEKITLDFDIPSNLQIKMPENTFNLREIYVYSGAVCNPGTSQVVYNKRLFNNMSTGQGYTSRVKDDGSNSADLFQPDEGFYGPKYYYNIQNGLIMLSRTCSAYPFLRVTFNGMGGVDGSNPVIPRFFQRAIVDFVEERYYNAMKSRNPRTWRVLWADAQSRLDSYTGNWAKAKKRVTSMDSATKESMEEYISSMYHK